MNNEEKLNQAKSQRLNEINYNNFGTPMKIIEYKSNKNITIEFQDEYKVKRNTDYRCFKRGGIKNPYDKEVCGVGCIGEGKYDSKFHKKAYRYWSYMIKRCYDPYELNKRPTYIDVYVCDEWLNFQNFAEWFYDNYYECNGLKMSLDKDILVKGNKIYSPNTCIFVPMNINDLFTKTDAKRGEYPIGVSPLREKLEVQCHNGNKNKYIGLFEKNQIREAWLCYKLNKELVIQSVADEYKELIPKELYEALYKYEVKIND